MTFASLQICHGSFFTALLKWLIYYHLFWCYILDMGELFTVPRCQEFLVTVQSNSGRALRVRLDAFLKADAAKAGHSSLS